MSLDIANTILNASPYFDDYNEDKKFHRVLFRPSVAVQARELNQVQSILQNQIERFGQHIFKDGTIIKGCGLSYLPDIDYISIADQFDTNTSLSSTNTSFVNAIAVGNTSGVVAQIIAAREGFSATSSPARFFIRYTQPGTNNERIFQNEEHLNIYQPGKSYIDKIILKITSASTANSQNFPNGARLINQVSRARGFITNAYSNSSGSYIELRNVRKTFANNDVLVLSTDEAITATINDINYINYANSFIDSVKVLANSALYNVAGFAYGVAVSPGIVFHKGHFIKVDSHITIVNEDDRNPAGKILYFNTTEEIIKETNDSSLYDNASGTSNINAPGAHRLKLSSTLIARDKAGANAISNTDIAFPIVEFSNTGPVFQRTNTQYNILGQELAKRTFEESGHYVIKPFNVSSKPDVTNPNNLVYDVTQGLAYVRGQRVELLNNLGVSGRRGTDTLSVNEAITSISYGNYTIVDEVRGNFPIDTSGEVRLYGTAQDAISTERMTGEAATGSVIGYANVRAIKYSESASVKKSSPSAQYRLYLFNIRMSDGYSFADTRSIVYYDGSINQAFADTVLVNSRAVLNETGLPHLMFGLNAKAVRNLRNKDNVYDTNYFYTAVNTAAQILSTGAVTFGLGASKGIVGFSDGSDASEALIDIILKESNAATATLTGTVSASATNVITGSGTTFTNDFVPGECIQFDTVGTNTALVVSIASNTSMTVNSTFTLTANTFRRAHIRGSTIALNPATGSKRTLTVATNRETATVDLGDTYIGTTNVIVRFYAYNNEATNLTKQINRDCVVIINTSNNSGSATGKYSLGVPDVLRLTGVYLGTNTSNFSLSTNKVSDFVLDNGQRDTHYDHATISISPKTTLNSITNSFLLVQFDCFTANATSGEGFFSVESYPANDAINANASLYIKTWEIPSYFSASSNTVYDLRDTIDFRPYKANTANITTSFTDATINPATTNNFNANTTTYNPYPGSTLTTNFTHYLGRKDKLIVTGDGLFKVEEGISDIQPRFSPSNPDVLTIAEIDVKPYPSLTDVEKLFVGRTDYNIRLNLLTHKRFTMKDISVLEKRIERLEYYTTLNMLEKIALQTTVPDDSGNARFQNGFFVDPFNSHAFGRTSHPDYRVAIDENNGLLRPAFHPEIIEMEFDTNVSSYSNVAITGGMVSLDYQHEVFIDQPYASEPINVSGTPIRWAGTVDMRPTTSSDVELLASPAAVTGTSSIVESTSAMNAVTPGIALYGWWREDIQNTSDYDIVQSSNEVRDQTSTPITTTTPISTEEGATVVSNVIYLSKEKVYAFKAVGLKPNTRHYLFINNINNTNLAALGEISSTPSATDESFVTRNTPWGTPLESDSRGEIIGKFIVPAFSLKAGTHKLTLRNRDTITSGIDDSIAEAYFSIDISLIEPPTIVEPGAFQPPDGEIGVSSPLQPGADAGAPNPDGSGVTSNSDIRVDQLDSFARFTVSGNTVKTYSLDSAADVANGEFTLTFTDDSYVSSGSISSYEWNFGAIPKRVICSTNTATGVGTHTVTFETINSIERVAVSLKTTDSSSNVREYKQNIFLAKLPSVIALKPAPSPAVANPENTVEMLLLPTLWDDVSDIRAFETGSNTLFDPGLANTLNLPLQTISYDGFLGLGSNTTLKIVAKPDTAYSGNVVWTTTVLSGAPLSNVTYANVSQVYVASGGSGYSNTDTIRFSNGQVDGYASVITNTTGGITSLRVTARGNFTDGTPATTSTYIANSTVNNAFTLTTSSTNTSIQVAINGIIQRPETDFYVTGGTTLNLDANAALNDVVLVYYNVTGTPGTGLIGVNNIRVQVANSTAPANSTNGNTSSGTGATLEIIVGPTANSVVSSPSVTNDVLMLFGNTANSEAESIVRVKADFYLANGYANSVANTTIEFRVENTTRSGIITDIDNVLIISGSGQRNSRSRDIYNDLFKKVLWD